MSFREREKKWQAVWKDHKIFEPQVEKSKQKFFVTAPYPYVNGLPHVGHLFTYMRAEAFARYKRAKGYNVLYPQGWHCTGQPIVNAAGRIAAGDPKQIQILKDFGVSEKDIARFTDPDVWIEHFVPGYKHDFQSLGFSIDWTREFITTDKNPHYDAFIRWQMAKLKEQGLIDKGKHAVVWCPKEGAAVGDHGRIAGEGETSQEFTLVIFPLESQAASVVCATLRPETIPGVTNIWINPQLEYVLATVDGKQWIMSKPCAEKLAEQDHKVTIQKPIKGSSLIGQTARAPTGRSIPLLPASFPVADKGSGIVLSVPSDAPDDYVALRDLQGNEKLLKEYKLKNVDKIKPIPIIDTPGLGDCAAVTVVDDMKIVNQKDRQKLEEAKKLVYKKGFYEGVMVAGDYAGEKVEVAKEKTKEQLLATGQAVKFYELTGPVTCRCLTACIVKIVEDQWFILYSDEAWKEKTRKALANMRLYPEKARPQFEYVIGWLREWACTRSEGLGTRLPWDQKWLVESLSDSTFYNAYYTIAHILKSYPLEKTTPELFAYVFLGNGHPHDDAWRQMRESYTYWYPVDFRNSGKDLIQNHLTFMLFTHTALVSEEHWPKGYGVNGWVTVDGKKMSKSLGNLIPVRTMVEEFGADASRLTILNGGESLDDPNWDTNLAKVTGTRLDQFLELIRESYGKGRTTHAAFDDWFESKLHSTIKAATEAMEETNFRTAIQHSWFDLANTIKEYRKLTNGDVHKDLFVSALEAQTIMLQPFTPHTSEEAWRLMGKSGFASTASWPAHDEAKIRPDLEASHHLTHQLESDIRHIQTLAKLDTIKEIVVILAPSWKYELCHALADAFTQTRNPGELIPRFAKDERFKDHKAELAKLIPSLIKDPSKLPPSHLTAQREEASIKGASAFLHEAFGGRVIIEHAESSKEQKAAIAMPGKPAVVLR